MSTLQDVLSPRRWHCPGKSLTESRAAVLETAVSLMNPSDNASF